MDTKTSSSFAKISYKNNNKKRLALASQPLAYCYSCKTKYIDIYTRAHKLRNMHTYTQTNVNMYICIYLAYLASMKYKCLYGVCLCVSYKRQVGRKIQKFCTIENFFVAFMLYDDEHLVFCCRSLLSSIKNKNMVILLIERAGDRCKYMNSFSN